MNLMANEESFNVSSSTIKIKHASTLVSQIMIHLDELKKKNNPNKTPHTPC